MAISQTAIETIGSDEWWLKTLMTQMNARPVFTNPRTNDSRRNEYTRNDWLDLLWSYHVGEVPLTDYNDQWASSTRRFLRLAKTGYANLLSTSLLERVRFTGVRVVSTVPDVDGDAKVRRILSANGQAVADALEFSAVMGVGYISVSAGGEAGALLSAEDPRGMIDAADPVTGEVRAVLKLYRDELMGLYVAALYIADDPAQGTYHTATYTRSTDPSSAFSGSYFNAGEWMRDETMDAPVIPGRGVPIVPVRNKGGRGEAEPFLELLDRIHNGIADRLWAVKHQVHRQRALEGLTKEDLLDENGSPRDINEMFSTDPASLWALPTGAKLHEFGEIQTQNVLLPIRDDVKELAATAQVPLPMMMPDQANSTATGADLIAAGLLNKAKDRIARWSPAVVRVAKLALLFAGEVVPPELEAMSEPVDVMSAGQIAQLAIAAAVPREALWSDVLQQSPETVARWSALYDQEALLGTAPQVTVPNITNTTVVNDNNSPRTGE